LLAGSLRGEFGVGTNEGSPADGRVVHLGHGCGAHSGTGKEDAAAEAPRTGGVIGAELGLGCRKPAHGAETSGAAREPAASDPERAACDKWRAVGLGPGDAGTSGPGADSSDHAPQGPDPQGPGSAAQGPGPDAQGVQSSDPAPEKESADAATGSDVRVVGPA